MTGSAACYTKRMSDDQFTKLFKYVEETRQEVSAIREDMATREDVDKILRILDKQSELLDTDEVERLALSAQVGRLQDWAERAGAKIGTEFSG